MIINIYNRFEHINFNYNEIINDVCKVFENYNNELSLILINNNEIHKMNKEYRSIDRPTDVLSFESDEEDYIGDIFISIEKVVEQAIEYNHSTNREFAFLLVHGILHLLGYDHMIKEDEEIMFKKQDEIMKELGEKYAKTI